MFWSQDPIKKTTKTCFELPCNLSSSNKSTEALPELLDGNGRSEIIVHCYEHQLTTCGETERSDASFVQQLTRK